MLVSFYDGPPENSLGVYKVLICLPNLCGVRITFKTHNMIPSLNSATSVKRPQDTVHTEMDRREDEGSEDLSNAELYLKRSKKRGLYVETENAETAAAGTNVTQHLKRLLPSRPQPQRFLPRDLSPLPGRSDSKPFVWSVLNDSTPATSDSESDIHEANKQIRNTIQEIQEAIKDINFDKKQKDEDAKKKTKDYDAAKKKTKDDDAKKVEAMSDVNLVENSRDICKSKSEKNRGCANTKDILEIRKKELTLTTRTVTKEPPTNRFSYRFVHEEGNLITTDTNQVKIRKRTASNDTNRTEAKRPASSKKIPDPIQITYNDIDNIKKTDNKAKTKYVNDLNSTRESMFPFLESDAVSKKGNDKTNISSYINEQQNSSKNIVVIQPNKELSITSQSHITDSEELEVLDIDLNTTSYDTMSYTKTLMGNDFYTNNNDRSKALRKKDTNTYSSDDNEVFGIYSNYNEDEETIKSDDSQELPFLYDNVDDINRKEHSYELARYLLDEKQASNAYYSDVERRRHDEHPRRNKRQKRVHIAPKTITPSTTNYPRRNKKLRRTVKSFANAEKRRKYIEKQKLINLIKQQLSMDYVNMEPPRSVFEELKEMAKNKRRRNRRVSFANDLELYERRLRIPDKRSQIKQRHAKRFKKNPQSIIRQNKDIYKDTEFFNKVAELNKRFANQKTKIMSPGYVKRKINEIHEELSDMEDDNELELDEGASLEVFSM